MTSKNSKTARTERTTAVQLTKDEELMVNTLRNCKKRATRQAGQFQAYLDVTGDPTAAAVLMLRDTLKLVVEGQGMQIHELFDEVEILKQSL